jgi:hypothetical protein
MVFKRKERSNFGKGKDASFNKEGKSFLYWRELNQVVGNNERRLRKMKGWN